MLNKVVKMFVNFGLSIVIVSVWIVVYILFIINRVGYVCLIFFIWFNRNISRNGIKNEIIGNVYINVWDSLRVDKLLICVFVIIGILIVLKVLEVVFVIK